MLHDPALDVLSKDAVAQLKFHSWMHHALLAMSAISLHHTTIIASKEFGSTKKNKNFVIKIVTFRVWFLSNIYKR
jgi:hypothetical protein